MKNQSFVFRMQFVKQPIDIPVGNLDERTSTSKNSSKPKRHSDLLPNNVRCIIAGGSNSGKTNVLISLIESENALKFENLYLFSKTLDQEKYRYLCEMLHPIKEIGCYTFSTSENVIDPSQMEKNSLVVFDDMINDHDVNKTIVRNIFTLGRHRNLDVFYLCQTYSSLNKRLIRDNCNFAILFKQNDLNLRHVFDDFSIEIDMRFDQFRKLCFECWKEPFGFVCISLEHGVNSGRYRKNFNEYLQVHI